MAKDDSQCLISPKSGDVEGCLPIAELKVTRCKCVVVFGSEAIAIDQITHHRRIQKTTASGCFSRHVLPAICSARVRTSNYSQHHPPFVLRPDLSTTTTNLCSKLHPQFPAVCLYSLNDSFAIKDILLLNGKRIKWGDRQMKRQYQRNGMDILIEKVLSMQHAEVWEEGGKVPSIPVHSFRFLTCQRIDLHQRHEKLQRHIYQWRTTLSRRARV